MRDISRVIIRGMKKGRVGNSRVRQGRPKVRWTDHFECGETEWHVRAQDRETWRDEERLWAVNTWIKLRGWPSLKRHVGFWEVNLAAGGGIPLGFLDQVRDIFGDQHAGQKRKGDDSVGSQYQHSQSTTQNDMTNNDYKETSGGDVRSQSANSRESGKVTSEGHVELISPGAPYPENLRASFHPGCLGPETDDFPLSWLHPEPRPSQQVGRKTKHRRIL